MTLRITVKDFDSLVWDFHGVVTHLPLSDL